MGRRGPRRKYPATKGHAWSAYPTADYISKVLKHAYKGREFPDEAVLSIQMSVRRLRGSLALRSEDNMGNPRLELREFERGSVQLLRYLSGGVSSFPKSESVLEMRPGLLAAIRQNSLHLGKDFEEIFSAARKAYYDKEFADASRLIKEAAALVTAARDDTELAHERSERDYRAIAVREIEAALRPSNVKTGTTKPFIKLLCFLDVLAVEYNPTNQGGQSRLETLRHALKGLRKEKAF
mgnify:CR=1 FL=1